MHVPNIEKNLVSISPLSASNNVVVSFDQCGCVVVDKVIGWVLLQGKLENGLYQLEAPTKFSSPDYSVPSSQQAQCHLVNSSSSLTKLSALSSISKKKVWHRHLDHLSDRVLSKILKTCNQKLEINETINFCDVCRYGKSHLLPFSASTSHAFVPLELIHTNIQGPYLVISNSSFKYYIHFVDDFSCYTWLYPLKQKLDALSIFLQFKTLVENKFDRKIKAIHSNIVKARP